MATTFSFSVDLQTALELDRTARAAGLTISAAMREAALDWIEKRKGTPAPRRSIWSDTAPANDLFDPESEPNAEFS